jgi:hypothetical protein
MGAMRIENISKDFVELGYDFLEPGDVLELNPISDVMNNEALAEQLRRLVDDGVVKVLDDPPEPVH